MITVHHGLTRPFLVVRVATIGLFLSVAFLVGIIDPAVGQTPVIAVQPETVVDESVAPETDSSPVPKSGRASVKPGINKRFLDPELDVDQFVGTFEVESREVFRGRDDIVAAMKLQPGHIVADVGTGTGLFIKPFAEAVGKSGQVLALDIAPRFIERVGKITESMDLSNVTPVLAGQDDVRLPPASVDVAFICDVYHHFEFPDASMASLHRAIRPGGTLFVIDFERIEGVSREWLLGHVRADKKTFTSEIEAAGFELQGQIQLDCLEENYFLRFTRP